MVRLGPGHAIRHGDNRLPERTGPDVKATPASASCSTSIRPRERRMAGHRTAPFEISSPIGRVIVTCRPALIEPLLDPGEASSRTGSSPQNGTIASRSRKISFSRQGGDRRGTAWHGTAEVRRGMGSLSRGWCHRISPAWSPRGVGKWMSRNAERPRSESEAPGPGPRRPELALSWKATIEPGRIHGQKLELLHTDLRRLSRRTRNRSARTPTDRPGESHRRRPGADGRR